MRGLVKNEQLFYYSLYREKTQLNDRDGYFTGDYGITYSDPAPMRANISPARGTAQTEQFGTGIDYDKVIVTCDMTCPIDENSVLFVDKAPAKNANGEYVYDYVVTKIAKSLNSISIAIKKAAVS
ncbi:MAG: hypothetical protein IIV44_07200 [Rikenellaceae bacterium]|nr:hypothetical protein [Rikenellaceae bacterium]